MGERILGKVFILREMRWLPDNWARGNLCKGHKEVSRKASGGYEPTISSSCPLTEPPVSCPLLSPSPSLPLRLSFFLDPLLPLPSCYTRTLLFLAPLLLRVPPLHPLFLGLSTQTREHCWQNHCCSFLHFDTATLPNL